MLQKITYIFLFIFLKIMLLDAQQMNFKNMGDLLNLPSQECYNVIQDSKGYIWFCTENGLCKYNGNTIKIFDKKNGLPEGGVYYIGEHKQGEISIITSQNRILKIVNDSIIEYPFTKKFANYRKGIIDICYRMSTDDDGNIIITSQGNAYRIDHSDFKITNLGNHDSHDTTINFIVVSQSGEDYLVKNSMGEVNRSFFDHQKNIILKIITKEGSKDFFIPYQDNIFPSWNMKIQEVNGEVFLNFSNRLVKIDRQLNCTIYNLPSRIISMYKDKEDGLWVGLLQKGVYYYKDIHKMDQVKKEMQGYSVSGTLMDKEGAVWFSTLEKGIFYCNNRYMVDYSNIQALRKPAALLKCIGDQTFVSTEFDEYMILQKDSIYHKKLEMSKTIEFTDVMKYHDKFLISNKGYIIETDTNFNRIKFLKQKRTGLGLNIYQMDTCKGKLFGISSGILFEIKNGSGFEIKPVLKSKPRCMTCCNDGVVLVGCTNGLYKLNVNAHSLIKIEGTDFSITKILKTISGEIWVATKGDGLFRLENNYLKRISITNLSHSDIFTDLEEDRHQFIWASTNNGLLKIDRFSGGIKAQEYNTSNGLISNNVRQIAINSEKIFISTSEGLCSIPVYNSFVNATPPGIFINSVVVNNHPVNYKTSTLVFPYNENSFTITFDVLTYKDRNTTKLIYKFVNKDDSFKLVNQTQLVFDKLKPDVYELEVYALNNDGIKSTHPVTFKFEIQKPFWQTLWFILFCLTILGFLTLTVVNRMIFKIKIREAEKTAINKLVSESQLSALQSQMNPHFIFNAINSIQNYILKNEEQEAYSYLAKFSKLIRMVLNNSRENSLLLDKELETLKLYVELEQLRFNDHFEFILKIDDDVDSSEIEIPTMLIQPYIENAIWHGLMNLKEERKGVLKLKISYETNLLKIVIEDNGIGRERSNGYKKEDLHQPIAMKLTEQRLSIIKKTVNYEKVNVSIHDLYDTFENSCGTRVELYLPVMMS